MTLTWNRQGQYMATAASLLIALVHLLYFNSLLAAGLTLAIGLWVAWNRNEAVTPSEWRLLASAASLITLFLAYSWLRQVLPYHYNLVAFAVLAGVMVLFVPPVWRRLAGRPPQTPGWRTWIAASCVLLLLAPHAAASPVMVPPLKRGSALWCDDVLRVSPAGAPRVEIQQSRVKVARESPGSLALNVDFQHRFGYGVCFPQDRLRPIWPVVCRSDPSVEGCGDQLLSTKPEACALSLPPVCHDGNVEYCIAVYPSPCGGGYEQIPQPFGCWRMACPNAYITPSHANVKVYLTLGKTRHQVVDEDVDFGVGGILFGFQACLRGMRCGLDGKQMSFHASIPGITPAKLQEWGFPKNTGVVYVQTTVTYTYRAPQLMPLVCRALDCGTKPVGEERTVERTALAVVRLPFGAGQWQRPFSSAAAATSNFLWNTVDEQIPGLGLGALLQPGLVDQVRQAND